MNGFEAAINSISVLIILLVCTVVASLLFWLLMMVDCIRNKEIQGSEKAIWIGIVLFGNCLGGLAYFVTIRSEMAKWCAKYLIVVAITIATTCGLLFLVYTSKMKYEEYQLLRAKKERNIVLEKEKYEQQPSNNKQARYEPRPHTPLNQTNTDRALVDPRDQAKSEAKYVILNKQKYYRVPVRTKQEIANIEKDKYSENLKSWVDSEGNIHFTNADLQQN